MPETDLMYEGCGQTFEAVLAQTPGVKRVSVSFDAREAQVEFDAGVAKDAGIVSAIGRAGFRAGALAR